MNQRFVQISLIWAIFAGSSFGQTILIDQGGGLWREGSWQDIPANQVVRVVRLDASDQPDQPEPPPKPDDSLTSIVSADAKAIGEPSIAESLAIGYATVAGQIERGTATSKAKIVAAQRQANTLLLASSTKTAQWNALLDKTWEYLDAEETAGKIINPSDMAPYWREIETGLKSSASATWEIKTNDNGPQFGGKSERLSPERWKLIIQLILQIIFQVFGGDN